MNETEAREKQLILRHYYSLLHAGRKAYDLLDKLIEETRQDIFKIAPQAILDKLEPIRSELGKVLAREDL